MDGVKKSTRKKVLYVFLKHGFAFGYSYASGDECEEKFIKKDLTKLLENKVVKKV